MNPEEDLTPAEKAAILYSYYVEKNIYRFVCCANGLPNMKEYSNKIAFDKAYENLRKHRNNIIKQRNNRKVNQDEHTCPICYEHIDDGKVILGCNHSFCLECYNNFHIRNNQCPMCRQQFTEKKYTEMPENFLTSMYGNIHEGQLFPSLFDGRRSVTFQDNLNHLLRNMNYSNMKDTKKKIMNMVGDFVFIYGQSVANFYGKQFFK